MKWQAPGLRNREVDGAEQDGQPENKCTDEDRLRSLYLSS